MPSGERCSRFASRAGVVLALLGLASVARAQSTPASNDPAAEEQRTALYRQGFDAATAGRWVEAKARFASALAIRVSPKVLFSLAQAEEQLGELASASRDYARAVDGAKAARETEVVSPAERALSSMAPRVPSLRIVVSGAAAANATLDGQPVAVGPLVPVDPGTHLVKVTAPGMRDVEAPFAIGERQHLDVPVRLLATEVAPAPRPVAPELGTTRSPADAAPATADRTSPWPIIGLVTAGAGVVALGVGSYFGLEAKSKYDESNRSGCAANDDCTPAAASIRRDAISAANTSTVLFVAGGALAASGLVIWLVAPSSGGHGEVAVMPVAMAAGGGLAVNARW